MARFLGFASLARAGRGIVCVGEGWVPASGDLCITSKTHPHSVAIRHPTKLNHGILDSGPRVGARGQAFRQNEGCANVSIREGSFVCAQDGLGESPPFLRRAEGRPNLAVSVGVRDLGGCWVPAFAGRGIGRRSWAWMGARFFVAGPPQNDMWGKGEEGHRMREGTRGVIRSGGLRRGGCVPLVGRAGRL